MGILGYIIVGLLAGAIAKAIMPGKQGGGIIVTILLGIVGALVGGLLTNLIMNGTLSLALTGGFWISLLISIVGALIVLFIYGKVVAGRTRA